MHTMWKGTISFGLVNIPIKLHSAIEDKDITFRSLHKKCHTPIQYEKICPTCEIKIEKDEIIKGYEYSKGKFIVVEDEELKPLEKKREKAVEIIHFVKITDIDPIYFNKSYFLSPNEGGSKAYSLLRKALNESGKVGIAKIMIRSKEQLAVIRVYQNTLVMETIHYPDEVRKADNVPNIPKEEQISKRELDTAILLIDQLTREFNPEEFKDEYREGIYQLIETKRNETEGVSPQSVEKPSNVMDLMAALQASIDRTTISEQKKTGTTKRKVAIKKKKNA